MHYQVNSEALGWAMLLDLLLKCKVVLQQSIKTSPQKFMML